MRLLKCSILIIGLLPSMPVFAADRIKDLLEELTNVAGPPGFEEPVRRLMTAKMTPLADQVSYDGLGSVIAHQGDKGPRIMVDAHMDELGGMIRRTTADGFLTMQMLGGWLDNALLDQRWIIIGSKGPVRAITGIRDVHLVPRSDREKFYPRDTVFLDVGAKTAAEVASLGIAPGDPVVPDAPFAVLGTGEEYVGKAWDDRIGCAVLLEAMRRLAKAPHPNQIFYVATVQEETGLRGARAAAALVKPDIGLALESGVTGDTPGNRPEESQVKLGAGPGVFLYDVSAQPNRRLVALVKEVAAANKVPLQLDLVEGYGDDSAEIQLSNGGVPTVNLVVPTRYTHAHNGIIARRDFDELVDLVVALLARLDAATVAHLRDFASE